MITMRDEHGETCCVVRNSDEGNDDQDNTQDNEILNTANKFCVDYSKRGTAKCKVCKKCILKSVLRIGVYTVFKGKSITIFHHVTCFFEKMKRARVESNVIQAPSEVDGFEEISEADKLIIVNLIEDDKRERKAPFTVTYVKKLPVQAITLSDRKNKLKMMKVPSIKVLFTNADQLTQP